MALIRVVIVDDHEMVRDGLHRILEGAEAEIEVVGMAENGEEGVSIALATRPDVVLMDLRMPGTGGVQAISALRRSAPDVCVIALTTFDDDDLVLEAIKAGARGYLLKAIPVRELIQAIRTVKDGGTVMSPDVASKVMNLLARMTPPAAATEEEEVRLAPRETEILRLLAEGLDNREIAARLYLTDGTVKNYVSRIYEKLDAKGRTHAVARAKALGILA